MTNLNKFVKTKKFKNVGIFLGEVDRIIEQNEEKILKNIESKSFSGD